MARDNRAVVMFVHGPTSFGGDSVVLYDTLKHLDRERFSPLLVASPNCSAWTKFARLAREARFPIVALNMGVVSHLEEDRVARNRSRAKQGLLLGTALARLLYVARRERVDVVYTLDRSRAVNLAALVAKALRKPLIWHAHQPWAKWGRALRSADRVVLITEYTRRHYAANGLPPERLQVVYNGIDVEEFADGDDTAARKHLGIAEGTPIVLLPGRLSRVKGQLELVEAMPAILTAHPETMFVFAGDDSSDVGDIEPGKPRSMRAHLEGRLEELGVSRQARFITLRREDLAGYYRAATVVTVPSWEEPFGLVVIEAMAAGAAVVASNSGGIPESVVEGETGLLVPPRDAAALAAAVSTLLGDPAQRAAMGAAGQARVRACFTLERYSRELEQVLDDAMRRG